MLDPFGQADGLPELVWDPIAGCVDPITAERRAKAFTAGTIQSAASSGSGDAAATVLRRRGRQGAAVLPPRRRPRRAPTSTGVLRWVANPHGTAEPADILREHPHAAPHWHGLLQGAIHGDERTAANTITTVQQAMALFFQPAIRRPLRPRRRAARRPTSPTSSAAAARSTCSDAKTPTLSASPLMTALAEHILDTALRLANASQWGRLCPPMLACLDELPSTAPLPTLRTRMANERALGISFIYAAQTWRQLAALFGDTEARAIFGLTNVLALFGGGKDIGFNKEVSDLVGTTRVARTTWQLGGRGGRNRLRRGHARSCGPRRSGNSPNATPSIVAENTRPIIAKLRRCIDGKPGRDPARRTAAAAATSSAQQRATPARRRGARRRGSGGGHASTH